MGVQRGRITKPELTVGICGKHGGDPLSTEFCYRAGMNYVSCSRYRTPISASPPTPSWVPPRNGGRHASSRATPPH